MWQFLPVSSAACPFRPQIAYFNAAKNTFMNFSENVYHLNEIFALKTLTKK
jgi:hypothetical protein